MSEEKGKSKRNMGGDGYWVIGWGWCGYGGREFSGVRDGVWMVKKNVASPVMLWGIVEYYGKGSFGIEREWRGTRMMIPVAVGSSSLCWKFLSFTFFSKVGGSLSSSSFPKMKSYPPRMVVAAERVLSWWLADQTRLASSPMPRYKKDRVLPLVVQLVVYVPRAAGCSPGVSSFSRDPSLHLWVSSPLSKQHSQKANLPKPKLREFSLEVYHSLFPPILFFLSWKKDVTEKNSRTKVAASVLPSPFLDVASAGLEVLRMCREFLFVASHALKKMEDILDPKCCCPSF
ncbi:hypothetical protein LR48_Vigan07g006700 [Vigna angularis]|uniref:Uncharacterized protein n=1 Tax=Phaseolus angularis TaxID=3914 RepID=A0A0L9UUC4_PHAAN|nr:hypothetical protein LR48_Vigan07g006700 [Vigna angularis]